MALDDAEEEDASLAVAAKEFLLGNVLFSVLAEVELYCRLLLLL